MSKTTTKKAAKTSRKPAKVLSVVESAAAPTGPKTQSTSMHLQHDVTVGCTTRLADIAGSLSISTFKLGQVLNALHLRHRSLPTPEASHRGLGHRWYNGCKFLVEWHISGVTEVVTAHYDSIGWPSKPKPKASTTSCGRRCGPGR